METKTATTAKPSIFEIAKAKAPAAATKKNTVIVLGMGAKIDRFNQLKDQIKAMEGEVKLLEGEIKDRALTEFANLYAQQKSRPDSFILQSEGKSVMFLPTDRYSAPGAGTPEAEVDEKTIYTFNPEVLEKHIDVIGQAIMDLEIPEEDKAELLTSKPTKNVRKGALDRLYNYAQDSEGIRNLFLEIGPVCQLKNTGGK